MAEKRGWSSTPSEPEPRSEPLQLERADFGAEPPGALTCSSCRQTVAGSYFESGGKILCESCRSKLLAQETRAEGPGPFLRGALLGAGAALVSGFVWWLVRKYTGYELGLLAIGVGFLVGAAVKKGSGSRGGLRYQILAVFLVYTGVVLNYLPDVLEGAEAGAVDAVRLVGFLYTVPFLGGAKNILGILIIGFALWEAWKMNRHVPLVITGPYQPGEKIPAAAPSTGG